MVAKMADYEVGSRFPFFFRILCFYYKFCVMFSEMASCTFYDDAVRSCTRVLLLGCHGLPSLKMGLVFFFFFFFFFFSG